MASTDRLSALPDDVLIHILSLLPTKLSVSTSGLSRRWRFLWVHTTNLDFDNRGYDLINQVMLLHKGQTINTFALTHLDDCSDSEFQAWIVTLIDRNVRKLDICLDYQVKLPQRLFNCKTLVDLSLTCCGDIPMTGNVCLPALKKLQLDRVKNESDESLSHLLSGCPALEELVVCCYISSPTLSKLVVNNSANIVVFEVKLDTPGLRYLKLCDSMSENVSVGALTSLNEAYISFQCLDLFRDYVLYCRYVVEFVGKLYNVKCLNLYTVSMKQVPNSAFSALTVKFYNLTELVLYADCRFIRSFLENAENLEVLTNKNMKDLYWMEPKQVSVCLASHLRTVRIYQFVGVETQLSILRYILRNAKVLKRMEIHFSNGGDEFETIHRISLFERGSKKCQFAFY
ncbi:fbd-associated F-box protein at4g10400 [Phtheirospermum japonicum]|uniref:Fbd-associated F-box protein at4g10400 n=2 Tax=Phtheirospermum japonicum TaxID=374723 RepID=A0A830DG98_9LAMI|nr:fbd-associated F-box protein at4g10400 [Phtheirospermum japonicum]